MTPNEIETMIISRASEASLLKYQEAIGETMAEDMADRVDEYAHSFARHGDMIAFADKGSGVVDALGAVADIIRTSTFPPRLISLRKNT